MHTPRTVPRDGETSKLYARIRELEEENAVLKAEKSNADDLYKQIDTVAFECVSVNRAEGRYLSDEVLADPLYEKSGAKADDLHNFTKWNYGFWSGVLATNRLIGGNDTLGVWKRCSDVVVAGGAAQDVSNACHFLIGLDLENVSDAAYEELNGAAHYRYRPDANKLGPVLYKNGTLVQKLQMIESDAENALDDWPMLDT